MSPFQYGVDYTLIGGFQAMVGFLKVRTNPMPNHILKWKTLMGLFFKTQVFGYKDSASSTGWNITSERQQLISSLMVLGAFIGSCSAGNQSLMTRNLG